MRMGRLAIAFCASLLITPFGAAGALTSVESAPAASGDAPVGSSAIRFEENAGQTDPRARFIVRASGWTVFLNGSEALYSHDGTIVGMRLQSGDPWAAVAPGRQLPGFSNYFVGNDPAKWRSDVRSFDGVRFDGVLPGVDLRYH